MKFNLKDRIYFFIRIIKGKSDIFQYADFTSKLKLILLSLIKIPFSTYSHDLTLRFGSLRFTCNGNYEMYLYPEIFIDEAYSQIGDFGPKTFDDGYVVFDVGANVGFYSLFVSSLNPRGEIYAFEPHPRAIDKFKKNIRMNSINNVRLIEKAVCNKIGRVSFEANKYSVLSQISDDQDTGYTVSCISLDSFIEQYKIHKIDMLKIDAEFAEDEIIAGAETRTLDITEQIVLEYHSEDKKRKVMEILNAHNFQNILQYGTILYYKKIAAD